MSSENSEGLGKRSSMTRDLIRGKALERGALRSEETRSRVIEAMKTIADEIASNEGIYPHNKGAVSSAEVARRANVHPTTLFSPKQRDLGGQVRVWLAALKHNHVVGAGPAKRSLTERIASWRAMYDGLAQSHRDTELRLQQAEAQLELALKQLGTVRRERDELRERLGAAKVVSLRPQR